MEKYIEAATAQFEKLLKEQLARAEKMAAAEPPKDFASLDKITIGLCGGDGIGPIIMKEARRLLTELLKDEIGSGKIVLRDIEGLTIETGWTKGRPCRQTYWPT